MCNYFMRNMQIWRKIKLCQTCGGKKMKYSKERKACFAPAKPWGTNPRARKNNPNTNRLHTTYIYVRVRTGWEPLGQTRNERRCAAFCALRLRCCWGCVGSCRRFSAAPEGIPSHKARSSTKNRVGRGRMTVPEGELLWLKVYRRWG